MKKYITTLIILLFGVASANGVGKSPFDIGMFFKKINEKDIVFPFIYSSLEDNDDPDGEPFITKTTAFPKDKSSFIVTSMQQNYNEAIQRKAQKHIKRISTEKIEFTFSGPDNGYQIIFLFLKKNDQWKLVSFENAST